MGNCVSGPDPWSLAQQGSRDALDHWLLNGGMPDAIDRVKGRGSLLHTAARHDRVECIKLLLKNKADVNVDTSEHGTPLHAAAASGASNAVTVLLASGACTTARFRGHTAAELARQAGYPAIANFIQMNHTSSTACEADPDSRLTDRSELGPLPSSIGYGYPPRGNHSAAQRAGQQHPGRRSSRSRGTVPLSTAAARGMLAPQPLELSGVPHTFSDPSEIAQQLRARPDRLPVCISLPASHPQHNGSLSLGPSAAAGAAAAQGGHSRRSPSLAAPSQAAQARAAAVAPPSRQQLQERPHGQARAARQALRTPAAVLQRSDSYEEARREMLAWSQQLPMLQSTSSSASAGGGGSGSTEAAFAAAGVDPAGVPADAAACAPQAAGGSSGRQSPDIQKGAGSRGAQSSCLAPIASSGSALGDPATPVPPWQHHAPLASTDECPPLLGREQAGRGGGCSGSGGLEVSRHGQEGLLGRPESPVGHISTPVSPLSEGGKALHGGDGPEGGPSASSTSAENSRDSSAANSLVNDPFLKALQDLFLRPPSLLPPEQRRPPEQQQQQQQPEQQQQQPPLALRSGSSGSSAMEPTPSSTPTFRSSSSRSLKSQPSSNFQAVDIRHWQIDFADLQLQKKAIAIGEGSFGKVYVAKLHETPVAVKVLLDLEEQQPTSQEEAWTLSNPILHNLQRECKLMASLRHPNVVQFMGVTSMPPAMITEYCARGSLYDVLQACSASRAKAAQMPWLRRLNMALDAAKGMLYLHKRGIIHRDLKSPNLLVESAWRVKVADFNLSKIVEDTSSGRSAMANMNPKWLAPEVLNGDPATTASDVFSWGVVMWELLTFQVPWPHTGTWQLVGKLSSGERLTIPPREDLPGPDTSRFAGLDAYVALMQRCWAQDPAERPGFKEVIQEIRLLLEGQARVVGGCGGAGGPAGGAGGMAGGAAGA